MKFKNPSSSVEVEELQTAVNWMEGQLNLLVAFITSNEESRSAFLAFAKIVANAKLPPESKEMQKVAQILTSGLTPPGNSVRPSGDSDSPPSEQTSELGSNVIQFPQPNSDK